MRKGVRLFRERVSSILLGSHSEPVRLISSSTQKKPEDWTVPGSSYLTPACGISVREKHYLRVNLCAVRPVHHRLVETTFGGTSLPEMSHAATDVFIILPRKFSLFNFFNTFPQLYFVTEDVNYLLPGFFVSIVLSINQFYFYCSFQQQGFSKCFTSQRHKITEPTVNN